MGIHDWIMDIHDWIIDIHISIMDIYDISIIYSWIVCLSSVRKISHFVANNFLVIRTNFAHSLTTYVSYVNIVAIGWSEPELACPNPSRHRLNLNQSKTNYLKNSDSDGIIVRDMGPCPECIIRSLRQFIVRQNAF